MSIWLFAGTGWDAKRVVGEFRTGRKDEEVGGGLGGFEIVMSETQHSVRYEQCVERVQSAEPRGRECVGKNLQPL